MKKTKKFISLFITICLLMTFIPMQMAYADSAFSGGNGTKDDPYLITNANDFKQLATEVNGEIITAIHILKFLKPLRKLLNFQQMTDMFR